LHPLHLSTERARFLFRSPIDLSTRLESRLLTPTEQHIVRVTSKLRLTLKEIKPHVVLRKEKICYSANRTRLPV